MTKQFIIGAIFGAAAVLGIQQVPKAKNWLEEKFNEMKKDENPAAQTVADVAEKAAETVDAAKDKAAEAVSAATEKVEGAVDAAKDKVAEAVDAAKEKAGEAAQAVAK